MTNMIRKSVLVAIVVGVIGLSGREASAGSGSARSLKAGAAKIDVTPETLPVRVAGSIGEKTTDKITDPLHVRSLVLDDGESTIAIAVVDSCLMGRSMIDRAKEAAHEKTGIPTDRMLVSATHTHSAPPVKGVHGNDPVVEYRSRLEKGITTAITEAFENRRPAKIGWGSAPCHEYVFCRRWEMKPGTAFTVPFTGRDTNRAQMNPGHNNPDKLGQVGPVDPEVTVLSVQTRSGEALALLANYSTHYAGAPGISADYFGVFAREMQERLPNVSQSVELVGIMSNGTSADANCIDFAGADRDFDRFDVATAVADSAMAAIDGITYRENVPVGMVEREMTLGVRMPNDAEVAKAKSYLEEHLSNGVVESWEENYARETVLLSKLPPKRHLKLQAMRIGDFAMTAIPCEVYGSTGLALKTLSPFRTTMNVSLANGCLGYLPPPEQFALGGYTTWRARSSCLEKSAEPKIRSTLVSMLEEIDGPLR